MERDKIIEALECCHLKSQDCISCPFTLLGEHCGNLEQSAVTLIKELTGTIDSMERQIGEKNQELDRAYRTITELTEEIKDLEAEYDRVYEQAEADIRGNMADGGTSCHWCADKTKADTVKRMKTLIENGSSWFVTTSNGIVTNRTYQLTEDKLCQIAKELLEENNECM